MSYDPCYHQFCDNLTGEGQDEALYATLEDEYNLIGNVNTFALDVDSDALAAAVTTFAFATPAVNGVRVLGKSHPQRKEHRRHARPVHSVTSRAHCEATRSKEQS